MSTLNDDKEITVAEAAKMMDVSSVTIHRMLHAGHLHARRVTLFPRSPMLLKEAEVIALMAKLREGV